MARTPPPGLAATIARLVATMAPDEIVLFGSYARGQGRPGSDIDLLVVAPRSGEPARELRRARQFMAGSYPPVDLLLCTPSEAAGADSISPFLRSVLHSGITVYLRDGSFARSRRLARAIGNECQIDEPTTRTTSRTHPT